MFKSPYVYRYIHTCVLTASRLYKIHFDELNLLDCIYFCFHIFTFNYNIKIKSKLNLSHLVKNFMIIYFHVLAKFKLVSPVKFKTETVSIMKRDLTSASSTKRVDCFTQLSYP